MRILILSFYYPPDIGPGSLRGQSLAHALAEIDDEALQIDVLTTMPNRYHSLAADASEREHHGKISVQRVALPIHHGGMAGRARTFLAYLWAILKAVRGQRWDLVCATSSRLMTASLGAWIARRSGARLYLDVRDLFTDTMEDVLANSPLRSLLPIFRLLERWTFRSADKINIVSPGFLTYLKRVAPALEPTIFTNGIDAEFVAADFFPHVSPPDRQDRPLVLYAGNIGEGQGLEQILPAAASALEGMVDFRILGDGGERQALQRSLDAQSLGNVQILDPVPRQALFEHYREADVLFLHLNDYKAFHKVLPSKIFEYAATGKPILAGVSGQAADFLRASVPSVAVFDPCDADALQAGLRDLLNGPRRIDRSEFCARHLRKNIMRAMARDMYAVAKTA